MVDGQEKAYFSIYRLEIKWFSHWAMEGVILEHFTQVKAAGRCGAVEKCRGFKKEI